MKPRVALGVAARPRGAASRVSEGCPACCRAEVWSSQGSCAVPRCGCAGVWSRVRRCVVSEGGVGSVVVAVGQAQMDRAGLDDAGLARVWLGHAAAGRLSRFMVRR